jgi:hypothetical protein
MRLRLGAAAAGVVLIAAGVLAFSLAKHPAVAGSNEVQPLYDTVFLEKGRARYCQQLPSLPAETSRLQVRVSQTSGPVHGLDVAIMDARGRLARGRASQVGAGDLTISLDRPTPARGIRHAGVCFANPGRGEIVLAGETKRCTPRDTGIGPAAPCVHPVQKPPGEKYRWLVGVRFLRSGSTSWLSEANLMLDRFGLGQAGWFGEWAAWLAAAFAALAVALALWWVAREPRSEP